MTPSRLLDTNILVYAFAGRVSSPVDPRNTIAWELLADGGRVSVQVLNEFVDVLLRKHRRTWDSVARSLAGIRTLCGPALPLTDETQSRAVEISMRYGFRIYDSMILASALEAGCTTVYSEDLQHGQTIEGLRIENPFLQGGI